MFQVSNFAGDTVTLKASLWQWMKAGVGFTLGFILVSFVIAALYYTILLPSLVTVLFPK